MDQTEALGRMSRATALWSIGHINGDEIVQAACDLLASGCDGPNLAMLAAVSFRHADEEVPDLLPAALRDVGLPYYARDSKAGREAAVRTFAAQVLTGSLAPRDLARWAHRVIGHGALELAERLVDLDDVYDTLDHCDLTEDEVDADVLTEARRITEAPHADDPSSWKGTEVSRCDDEYDEGSGSA